MLDALEPPPLPPEAAHVWSDFLRLSRKRTHGMNGPNPITYREMSDYEQRFGITLSEEGAQIIDALDEAYLLHAAERSAPTSATPLTPKDFGGPA